MDTTQHITDQDPLGLNRFALTESAYDLVNSIQGAYGRMSFAEGQKENSDQNLINYCRNRSKEIGRAYRRLAGKDLSAIDQFIQLATDEWHQVTKLENERILFPFHVS